MGTIWSPGTTVVGTFLLTFPEPTYVCTYIWIGCYHRLNKTLTKWKHFIIIVYIITENQCDKLFHDIPLHAISTLLNNSVWKMQVTMYLKQLS